LQIVNLTQALVSEFNTTLAYNPYPTPGKYRLFKSLPPSCAKYVQKPSRLLSLRQGSFVCPSEFLTTYNAAPEDSNPADLASWLMELLV
jgi:hypothetical protein